MVLRWTRSIFTTVTVTVLIFGIFFAPETDKTTLFDSLRQQARASARDIYTSLPIGLSTRSVSSISTMVSDGAAPAKRGDVYFLSHGGPPTVEQYDSEPYGGWKKFGKLVKANKPEGIVVVSAHWENDRGGVVVNNNPSNPLIYDFYNFPKRFYELKFESRAEPEFQSKVVQTLKSGGIIVEEEDRGLDHGVWIPFLAALGPSTDIPIVQVSLPASSDPRESVKLGKVLSKLRDDGYSVIGTGQVVHNLRDLFSGKKTTYARPFLNAVIESLAAPDPIASSLNLVSHPRYKEAQPTDEHFFPLYVSLGATKDGERPEDIYVDVVGAGGTRTESDEGLGWGMWRWSSASA